MLAGLPTKLNTRLSSIQFPTCPDSVTVLEMAEPVVEELLHLEREGTAVYDAHLQCNVLAWLHCCVPLVIIHGHQRW